MNISGKNCYCSLFNVHLSFRATQGRFETASPEGEAGFVPISATKPPAGPRVKVCLELPQGWFVDPELTHIARPELSQGNGGWWLRVQGECQGTSRAKTRVQRRELNP